MGLRQKSSKGLRQKRGGKRRLVFYLFCTIVSCGFFIGSLFVLYISWLGVNLPSFIRLDTKQITQSTKIFDRTGEILLYEIHGAEQRTIVPFEEIPLYVKQATLAAEDTDFYSQPAFDWKAIGRALIVNLRERRIVEGGSTITQQLVKNIFLTSEKTIIRKMKELILAIELESRYSKDEILWFYLNQIPYGSTAYGIEAASRMFFAKSVRDLTLAEAALLAALPKAPTYYSPWGKHTDELLGMSGRHYYIINRMVKYNFITQEQGEAAKKEKLKFIKTFSEIKAPHFSFMVRDYLIKKYGEDIVLGGGLKVRTTLDWPLQEIAEKAVKEGATRNTELYEGRNAALVAQDPKTGQILALVGSKNFFAESEPEGCSPGVNCKFEPEFNIVTQGLRQPGSALKPFVYLTAFEKGYSPETIIFDTPTEFAISPNCSINVDFTNNNPECFHPTNFDDRFRGPITFAEGLAHSLNIPSVKVLYLAGLSDSLKTLRKFGVTTLTDPRRYGLSLVLGGGEIRLIELINAYATLSEEGVLHEQAYILEVKDTEDKILESFQNKTKRVMGAQLPRVINQILSDGDLRAGLFRSNLPLTVFSDRDVALKTGTTQEYRDAWAFGYIPSLVVGVWAGNNDNTSMIRKGGSILAAIPIWNAFLKEALKKFPPETFEKPEEQILSSKPMLNGTYVYRPTPNGAPQIHSLLYYVKKNDPLGVFPENPYEDSQFANWETGVLGWAATYGFDALYNSGWRTSDSDDVLNLEKEVDILNVFPKGGSFVTAPFLVKADILAKQGLRRIDFYFNHRLLVSLPISGKSYSFNWFVFEGVKSQNIIELRVFDVFGHEASEEVIVYQ